MPEHCIVRMATVKDLDALVRLEKLGFTSDQFDRDQILYLLSEVKAIAFVLERGAGVWICHHGLAQK
jgi:hypothetical protein